MLLQALLGYTHAMSLALWFGGLFGYAVIVWPAIMKVNAPNLPRGVLVQIGVTTAPWIYLAMVAALGSYLGYWFLVDTIPTSAGVAYLILIVLLIANNCWGSLKSWPAIMMAPDDQAMRAWKNFYFRMFTSLVFGLAALSLTLFVI